MDITFTALAVLAASLLGGYGLRALIHSAGRRWLHLGTDTVTVMGGIAFWGMVVGGLVMAVRMLAAPVLQFFAALVLMVLGMAAMVLGLGDTWADWRRRARPTT